MNENSHSELQQIGTTENESIPKLEIVSLNFRIPNNQLSFRSWKWFWDFYQCENKIGFGWAQ